MSAKEGPYTKAGFFVGVAGILVSYCLTALTAGWWPFNRDDKAAKASTCVNPVMDGRPDSPDRLRPPKDLSVAWDRSPTLAGRVSATLHWENVDPRTSFGLIEVTGRYGEPNVNDIPYNLDGRPLPAAGLCGHWLRRYNDADDDERGVFLNGLWAGERYCFAVNSSDPGGGVHAPYPSIKTVPVCEQAPWNPAWGSEQAVPSSNG
jgi:hypothetical protein